MSNPTKPHRRGRIRRWLRPGTGISGWLLIVFLGQLLLAVAGAIAIRIAFQNVPSDSLGGQLFDLLSLQFLPGLLRPVVVILIGAGILVYGLRRLMGVLLEPFPARTEPLVELVYQKRSLARGPRVVAVGGGTGLSTLLRGLKETTSNITAVVTVADDGGSSGKLRKELGIAPVGDIRSCITALADAEPTMTRLLQYRFPADEAGEAGLAGHAFGNLLIAALTDVSGDFEEAVRQSNRVLAVRGSVVPVAGTPITLHARLDDGSTLEGESHIERAHGIESIWITPEDVRPTEEALTAIGNADIVVIGPGSLYTSLLPPLLVPGMREALAATGAARLFVCNVATQLGETEGYGVARHMAALAAHGLSGMIDAVLVNSNTHARQLPGDPAAPVSLDVEPRRAGPPMIVSRDVVDDDNAHRHDSRKLSGAILDLYEERTGMRRDPVAAS